MVHLESVGAVFERVGFADRGRRKLARLAQGNEGKLSLDGQRRAQQESSGLDSRDQIDLPLERSPDLVQAFAHQLGTQEQRRDVAEQDSWLGEIGNAAHRGAETGGEVGIHDGLAAAPDDRRSRSDPEHGHRALRSHL